MADQIQKKSSWKETQHHLHSIYQKIIKNISKLHFDASEKTVRLLVKNIENNERQIDSFHRSKKIPKAITWRLEGPFDSSYSLALVNREIARALSNLGHKVVLHSTEGPGDFDANIDFLEANPSLAAMHELAPRITGWDADITSRNLYPPRVTDMESPLNFLHAYGWEESGFPLDWIDNFNQSLQGMTVMSRHVANIMVDHGFTKPIEVSSIGVDHWLAVEADEAYQLNAKKFRFLHVSSCFPRKGVDVMLKAFGQAFRDTDAVTLVIKTFSNPHNEVHRWLKEARANDPHYPDVQIIEGDFTDAQLKALYEQCDVLVAPSRAEGFGLPMAEAMLSGLAVITTGWSGQTDFCTEETAWLIDYRFERAKSHFGLFSSVWAEPDQNHLAQLMKVVHDLPPNERAIRVKSGQKLLLDKFKWQHTAARMVDAARKCGSAAIHDEAVIGWVSTWNTKCGIATYSEHLINNMDQSVFVLAPYASELTGVDQSNVYRSWSMGEEENFKRLEQEIDRLGINVLMVQFNYGFFNLENLSKFLRNQLNLGRAVFVTLHSTTDPIHAPNKKLEYIVSSLKICSRVLVHSIKDLNKLKRLGLTNNAALFPHGILDCKPIEKNKNLDHINQSFVVASYGFFLPHKGLLELIDAISIMKNKGFDVRLKMINSEYPAVESRDIISKARNKIVEFGISDIVELHTAFLEDAESLKLLGSADLIVFPYQETGESASGAVRYGIATGLPVAVTPLAIFDDVSAAVHKLPGTTASDIAKGIKDIADQIRSRPESFNTVDQASREWRAEHSYTRIGRRIGNMLSSLWLNKQINSRNKT